MPLVPVVTGGPDTTLPSGPQYGVKYVLTGPDGGRAAFNDPTDRDYIGALTEITGLDSPEVRESADNLVSMDGGVHGCFYYGRRPITMSGSIYNVASTTERNIKMTKLQRASNAMRGDATLLWTPDGGEEQYVKVRRQQPLRISGGWVKDFQIALVAADPRIYSTQLYTSTVQASGVAASGGRSYPRSYPLNYAYVPPASLGDIYATNQGNAAAPATLTITGPGTNPTITNATTGERLVFSITLGATDFLAVDMLNRTVLLNNTFSKYSTVSFTQSAWWMLQPGVNDIQLAWGSYDTGAGLTVQWRDAWI